MSNTTILGTDFDTLREAVILMALHQRIEDKVRLAKGRHGADREKVEKTAMDEVREKFAPLRIVEKICGGADKAELMGFDFNTMAGNGKVGSFVKLFRSGVLGTVSAVTGTMDALTNHRELAKSYREARIQGGRIGGIVSATRAMIPAAGGVSGIGIAGAGGAAAAAPAATLAIMSGVMLGAAYIAARNVGDLTRNFRKDGELMNLRRGQKLIEDRLRTILPQLPPAHAKKCDLKLEPTKDGGLRLGFYAGGKLDNPHGPALLEIDKTGTVTKLGYFTGGKPAPRRAEPKPDNVLTSWYHVTARKNLREVLRDGLQPTTEAGETALLYRDVARLGRDLKTWLGKELDKGDLPSILKVRVNPDSVTALPGSNGVFSLDVEVPAEDLTHMQAFERKIDGITESLQDRAKKIRDEVVARPRMT